MSKNESIIVDFPYDTTRNPVWEYDDVTGYIPEKPTSKDDFIRRYLQYVNNASIKHDFLPEGRDYGGGKKHKRKSKRHKKTKHKKTYKR